MSGKNLNKTKIISDNVIKEITGLKQAAGKDIIIFGSPSASHTLMQENLIDDYWLFINPILLGEGIPLFKNIKNRTNVNLIKTNVFSSGVVCIHYKKIPD